MCFVLLALQQHPKYPFILLSNRDEFYARPTAAMQAWADYPEVLGGRDLEAGGSWLALNRGNGRLALVTNYREAPLKQLPTGSRGALVQDWVATAPTEPLQSTDAYLQPLQQHRHAYAGYNLLLGTLPQAFYYYSNRAGAAPRLLGAGLYGLSNALLDTPWPKVVRSKQRLANELTLSIGALDSAALFAILADNAPVVEQDLPDTGIGRDKERLLAPVFINKTDFDYGTRCSTLIWLDNTGVGRCEERSFSSQGLTEERVFSFTWPV